MDVSITAAHTVLTFPHHGNPVRKPHLLPSSLSKEWFVPVKYLETGTFQHDFAWSFPDQPFSDDEFLTTADDVVTMPVLSDVFFK
jgi:hypothetical protein